MNAKVYSWQISQSSANKWKSTEKTPLTRTLSCTDVSGPFLLKQTDSHSFTKWDGPAGFLFQRGKPALIWQPQKMPISLHHFVWPDYNTHTCVCTGTHTHMHSFGLLTTVQHVLWDGQEWFSEGTQRSRTPPSSCRPRSTWAGRGFSFQFCAAFISSPSSFITSDAVLGEK